MERRNEVRSENPCKGCLNWIYVCTQHDSRGICKFDNDSSRDKTAWQKFSDIQAARKNNMKCPYRNEARR